MLSKQYSRLAKVEEKRNVRSAIIFGGLTVLILILALLYGVPLVARFAGLLSNLKGSKEIIDTTNLPPPPPPTISTLPEFTNQQSLHIEGNAQPGATVNIFFNGENKEIIIGSDGKFSGDYTLVKGSNTLYAIAKNKAGTSASSKKFTIVYDTEPPKLEVTQPKNGDSFYGDKQKQLSIQGITDLDTQVTINGRFAIVENDGGFQATFDLNGGTNSFTITALDRAGNKKEATISVNFTP